MDKRDILALLEEIGLARAESVVYIALLDGTSSVREIAKATGERRPTIYYSLDLLEKRGLVSKTGKGYGNSYQVEPVERLLEVIGKGIRRQTDLLEKAKALKDAYSRTEKRNKAVVSYFDDFSSVKSAVFFSLYGKGKVIRTIVPADNFFHQVSKEFVEEYVKEKTRRGIKTKALWENIPERRFIESYYKGSDIRQLPVDMHNSFETTVFIYDDKTLYIAPRKENQAVLIQSREHVKMMTAIFENIWKGAFRLK